MLVAIGASGLVLGLAGCGDDNSDGNGGGGGGVSTTNTVGTSTEDIGNHRRHDHR